MFSLRHTVLIAAGLGLSSLVASCGGDDSSNDQLMIIDSRNMLEVAALTAEVVVGFSEPTLSDNTNSLSLSTNAKFPVSGSYRQLTRTVVGHRELVHYLKPATVVFQDSDNVVVEDCEDGGTITTTYLVGEPGSSMQAGDSNVEVYDRCDEYGEVSSGTYRTLVLSTAYENGELTEFTVESSIEDYTTDNGLYTSSGSGTGISTFFAKGNEISYGSDFSSISVQTVYPNLVHELKAFSGESTTVYRENDDSLFARQQQSLDSFSKFDGDVQITADISGIRSLFPDVGSIDVIGKRSALKIEVLDDTFVELALDEDGDGVYDSVIASSWDELESIFLAIAYGDNAS